MEKVGKSKRGGGKNEQENKILTAKCCHSTCPGLIYVTQGKGGKIGMLRDKGAKRGL